MADGPVGEYCSLEEAFRKSWLVAQHRPSPPNFPVPYVDVVAQYDDRSSMLYDIGSYAPVPLLLAAEPSTQDSAAAAPASNSPGYLAILTGARRGKRNSKKQSVEQFRAALHQGRNNWTRNLVRTIRK
ncbi:hypothetical protein VB005_00798 [Metarhizium brunneum]